MATEPDADRPAAPDDGPPPAGPGWPGAVDAATRGLDAVLGREVAMVTLPPVGGEDLVVRTEQVRRLAGLHHAHLVEVFDVDGLTEGSESTLVLQSVAGRVLEPSVDLGRWAPITVAEVGAQVASALAHAHARGVVHGGIGPASLVLGGTPGAPYAWLTGFTAALHPAPPEGPEAVGDPAPSRPDDDVADLGRALAVVLDPAAPAAPALQQALADMVDGRVGARGAAESLVRVAEGLRHVDEDETSFVPVARPVPAPAGDAEVAEVTEVTDVVPPPRPGPRPVAVVAHAPRGRRRRLAGRGVRFAALGGAALALAAASGFVLWGGGEDPGTPREAGLSDRTAPAGPDAPVAVAPPGSSSSTTGGTDDGDDEGDDTPVRDTTTRSPITSDVTTVPAPVLPPAPPTVPPTVPPTTAPTTTVPTQPTTGPTEPTEPTEPTGTTTTTRPGAPRGATLAAP
ncbi:hypothetical protein ACFPK1_28635 [Actinomycetospora rhizophila]|uniref:Protein kinase domain-containing protein n=1 Tax=Actinomycetospora rhizophila TaxID=1416876 RepID=A0ABV9ZLD7_9PSEU